MNYTPETKWNADDQKIQFLMQIEAELEESFLRKDVDSIMDYLSAYRRQSFPKFLETFQNKINEGFKVLEKKYQAYKKSKKISDFNDYYCYAEAVFLMISQKIKEAGIYYREGKNASHAILQR